MNHFLRRLATFSLGAVLSIGLAQAATAGASHAASPLQLAANLPGSTPRTAPDTGAIRRANPNSRQGTIQSSPPVRGPNIGVNPRPPTLQNGGIGNGYPTRQQPPRPSSDPERLRGD